MMQNCKAVVVIFGLKFKKVSINGAFILTNHRNQKSERNDLTVSEVALIRTDKSN